MQTKLNFHMENISGIQFTISLILLCFFFWYFRRLRMCSHISHWHYVQRFLHRAHKLTHTYNHHKSATEVVYICFFLFILHLANVCASFVIFPRLAIFVCYFIYILSDNYKSIGCICVCVCCVSAFGFLGSLFVCTMCCVQVI